MATWGEMSLPPANNPNTKKKDYNKTPQELVGEFWDKFFTKSPGKVTSIFPRSLYATLLPSSQARGASSARNAAESYETAAKECRERVLRIVRECNRTNEKFTDPDFDIESDPDNNCLNGLIRIDSSDDAGSSLPVTAGDLDGALGTLVSSQVLGPDASVPINIAEMRNFISSSGPWPALLGAAEASPGLNFRSMGAKNISPQKSRHPSEAGWPQARAHAGQGVKAGESFWTGAVHRLDWIFESPRFTIDSYSSSDIKQGGNGDCWWLAAVATVTHRKDLMEKVCVARDEECGVYGFVFQRDGEWISTVVDDNLYLSYEDFDFYGDAYDASGKRAREHRKQKQTGSEALYFAKCADPNETWLPLLEKAYAKVHGDYEAISGGWSGEAVEDMTGGVTTTVATNRVLKKDRLWKELIVSDGEFVFALSAIGTGWDWKRGGLALGHAYSILRATEEVGEDGKTVRLVQVRNPWGERASNGVGEWNGPWSDGSKEWTPYWLRKINHTFGDDGVFWISYQDMLETFLFLHRTRLFDDKWTVVQQWTSVNVAWVSGYLNTKFLIDIKRPGMVVIVLAQLDDRYFLGFEGQYRFQLHFLLQEENGTPGDHICRVRPVHSWESRSVSCELDLKAGRYEVVPKITATRDSSAQLVEDVVKENAEKNPQKLRQVGMQYDLAHAKGGIPDEDQLLSKKKDEEKKRAEEKKRRKKNKSKRERLNIELSSEKATVTIQTHGKNNQDGRIMQDKDNENRKQGSKSSDEKLENTVEELAKPKEVSREGKHEDEEAKDQAVDGENILSGATQPLKQAEKQEENSDTSPDGSKADVREVHNKEVDGEEGENNDDDDEEPTKDEEKDELAVADDEAQPPWNAVCVVGLRVYAKDPEITIDLIKPSDPEEAASLSIDGQPAGATA